MSNIKTKAKISQIFVYFYDIFQLKVILTISIHWQKSAINCNLWVKDSFIFFRFVVTKKNITNKKIAVNFQTKRELFVNRLIFICSHSYRVKRFRTKSQLLAMRLTLGQTVVKWPENYITNSFFFLIKKISVKTTH